MQVFVRSSNRAANQLRPVRLTRGYTVHANDMLMSVKNPKAIERIH